MRTVLVDSVCANDRVEEYGTELSRTRQTPRKGIDAACAARPAR
jgi:hypothetical protein